MSWGGVTLSFGGSKLRASFTFALGLISCLSPFGAQASTVIDTGSGREVVIVVTHERLENFLECIHKRFGTTWRAPASLLRNELNKRVSAHSTTDAISKILKPMSFAMIETGGGKPVRIQVFDEGDDVATLTATVEDDLADQEPLLDDSSVHGQSVDSAAALEVVMSQPRMGKMIAHRDAEMPGDESQNSMAGSVMTPARLRGKGYILAMHHLRRSFRKGHKRVRRPSLGRHHRIHMPLGRTLDSPAIGRYHIQSVGD
ncbi:MAG: hypothetical protein D6698_13820 [Gammaproteobacteria bacterium]|nr:MAG: hypothetical protein D6698_13820 [Gammaproteobacteria bacterium]